MIVVQAPSRLHFGLLSLASAARWPNSEGEPAVPARQFGGVGLMVNAPGLRLRVEPGKEWSAEGPLAERALAFARTLAAHQALAPQRILVEQCSAEHLGLGTGTQLALAVSRALAVPGENWNEASAFRSASLLGRGARSALGIHGFLLGGFLVEGGKRAKGGDVAPLLVRTAFPEDWRIVLTMPSRIRGLHGRPERAAFDRLFAESAAASATDALCRLTLLGMLPALAERDIAAFGEALYDFNRRVGEMFATVQGGPYADPQVAEMVDFVRQQGVPGVGQSSWGPTVFAVIGDEKRANYLAEAIRQRFGFEEPEVIVTTACNRGAVTG